MDAVRASVRWLAPLALALGLACVLAARSQPAAGLAVRPRSEARLALPLPPSPWPPIQQRALVVLRGVVERALVPDETTYPPATRKRIAEMRAKTRVLERRLVELKRQFEERQRYQCGQSYRSNPYATSAADVMRGK